MGAPGRLFLQVVLLGAGLAVLGWLNQFPSVDRLFRAPASLPWLRGTWLPVSAALLFGMGWLVWWLWRVLMPDADRQEQPDLDAAWEEAVAALDAAGVG